MSQDWLPLLMSCGPVLFVGGVLQSMQHWFLESGWYNNFSFRIPIPCKIWCCKDLFQCKTQAAADSSQPWWSTRLPTPLAGTFIPTTLSRAEGKPCVMSWTNLTNPDVHSYLIPIPFVLLLVPAGSQLLYSTTMGQGFSLTCPLLGWGTHPTSRTWQRVTQTVPLQVRHFFPSCPMQMQCLQKLLRETQGENQVPGISHSSKRWKCQEFAALCEYGLTEFPCSLYFQKHQAQDNTALETGQKGPNNCTEMTKNSLTWASLSDYEQLGYNLRINLFQGEGTHRLPRPSKQVPSVLCQGSGSHMHMWP